MSVFKSIKWRLQLWYGLILVVLLVGFGTTAFQMERNRQFRRVDEELQRRFSIVSGVLRPPPMRGPNAERLPGDRPLWGPRPDDPGQRGSDEFHLPPQVLAMFDAEDRNRFYFAVDFHDGRRPLRSTNAPEPTAGFLPSPAEIKPAPGPGQPPDFRPAPPRPPQPRTTGTFREIVQMLPPDVVLRVGCSIAPELRELRLAAWKLAAVGAGVLFIGLAGGWWLAGRSLRPVAEISAAAAKISSGDLSQRINSTEAESELGQLAAVLNSTFARLETAFAQQKQFASDAAHELRTPVTVMLTQTQAALNRERSAEEYKQTIEACQRAAQRMRKLIESLLELARFDAGQEVLKRAQFDFSTIVADGVDLVQPLADERGVKTHSEISPLEITGDSERLAQVVTNLLTNAIQFNRPGGEVRARLGSKGGLAVLEISDTGAGIAPGDLPRVFERFYRADAARTGGGSAGLGLSICKAIVEAHGGTIEAASEPGSGSTFTVRLPA